MKKVALLLAALIGAASLACAQDTGANEAVTAHYDVYASAGPAQAKAIADGMEAFFDLYNSFFHFDLSALKSKLNVRIYANRQDFDSYLAKVVPATHDSFVYLQYQDPGRSVLVGYDMDDLASFERALIHHGFVQFLRTFIAQPPLWLQEGCAVYFEASAYDATQKVAVFRPNLGWIATLKQEVGTYLASNDTSAIIPLDTLLTMDTDAALQRLPTFYAEAWGLVSFLVNSKDPVYNRVLWDGIAALQPKATASANSAEMETRAFTWVSDTQLMSAFASYLDSVKTFPELVNDGMRAYSAGDLATAQTDFAEAIALNESNSIPYYYLGLVKYGEKDFYGAEHYFQTALQMGADRGLVDYALGVNAFADNRMDDAKSYLTQATTSAGYKDKADTLLKQIDGITAQ